MANSAGANGTKFPNPDSVHNVAALRQMFPFQGYIEQPKQRSVTIRQLRRIISYAQTRCFSWWDSFPRDVSKTAGQLLTVELLNFYHLNAWLVKPATKEHRCSLAELLSRAGDAAPWVASHAWAQSFLEFVTSLECHAAMRLAPAYWICAFAHRQHEAKEAKAIETGLADAFGSASGFLLCIDAAATAFQRAWCILEWLLALQADSLKTDIAVSFAGEVSVLTDGLAEADLIEHGQVISEEKAIQKMDERNKDFPLEVLQLGFDLEAASSVATSLEDRRYILERFEQIGRCDSELKARLLQLCWRCASEAVLLDWQLPEQLAKQRSCVLRLDLRQGELSDRTLHHLLKLCTEELQQVQLNLSHCEISEEGLQKLIQQLPTGLESLQLDLRHTASTIPLAELRGQELRHLSLRLGPLPALSSLPGSLRSLRLCLVGASDGSLQMGAIPGQLQSLVLELENAEISDAALETFLHKLPMLESLALAVPCASVALSMAPQRAVGKLRLRLGHEAGGASHSQGLHTLAQALPATLQELQLHLDDDSVPKSAIAMLAAHCPQSLTSVDLVIGEHRIQSPHQLAQWSSCEEDENQEAVETLIAE